MDTLDEILKQNRAWAARQKTADPGFFTRLAEQQSPEILWIGCSDSRLPPNEILDLDPGRVFVHRNVANVVVHTDLNCLSVLQYGIEVLGVRHVIVCGHLGCGGVRAAMEQRPHGLIDNWLRHIKDVYIENRAALDPLPPDEKADRLCELNVVQQVANVCHSTIVQDAWRRGQPLTVHGWVYGLSDGLVRDLGLDVARPEQLPAVFRMRAGS